MPSYLVEPVSRLSEWHGDAGAQVAARSVTVGEAGHHPLPFQGGQAHLDYLTQKKHGFGQRMAETDRSSLNISKDLRSSGRRL